MFHLLGAFRKQSPYTTRIRSREKYCTDVREERSRNNIKEGSQFYFNIKEDELRKKCEEIGISIEVKTVIMLLISHLKIKDDIFLY